MRLSKEYFVCSSGMHSIATRLLCLMFVSCYEGNGNGWLNIDSHYCVSVWNRLEWYQERIRETIQSYFVERCEGLLKGEFPYDRISRNLWSFEKDFDSVKFAFKHMYIHSTILIVCQSKSSLNLILLFVYFPEWNFWWLQTGFVCINRRSIKPLLCITRGYRLN